MGIGTKIRELRKERGITQEQLAGGIGISFQAVSKWENGIGLPDIALLPRIANYFGVSLDELFEFNLAENREKAREIARESEKYREKDQEKGRRLLDEALKLYPESDILLSNYLYLVNYRKEPDRTIELALRCIDTTEDDSLRYDALRFLAYAYSAKGDSRSALEALEQIPELYFSRLSEMAYILSGEKKRRAAEKQRTLSLEMLIEMLVRIAECCEENGDLEGARREYERALELLKLFDAEGEYWKPYKDFLEEKVNIR